MTAFETLGLDASATIDEIKVRWRELAGKHHPDRGGDAITFNTIRQAYQKALQTAQEPVRCPACKGKGKVSQVNGFYSVSLPCGQCHGKGEIKRGRRD